jgi:thymidylate synthase (FAD)
LSKIKMEVHLSVKVELYSHSQDEKVCGQAAAFCRGIDNPDDEQIDKSLKHAVDAGHESVVEFCHIVFKITGVSRAMTHQMVRHRLFSFAQISQRHSNPKGYVIPPSIQNNPDILKKYNIGMEYLSILYNDLLSNGVEPEDARFVLPNASETGLFVGGNARQWMHFFNERYCQRAQWEIREVARQCLIICKQLYPKIFTKTWPPCSTCPEPCGNPLKKY